MTDMKQLTQTDISQNLHHLIEVAGSPPRKEIERMTEKAGVKVTSTTLGNFLNDPEERSPWVKTILALAYVLRSEPWWLMVKDFPFEAAKDIERKKGKRLDKISADGYALLHTFENAKNDMVRYAMLDSIAHSLCRVDEPASNQIKELQAKYLTVKEKP